MEGKLLNTFKYFLSILEDCYEKTMVNFYFYN